LGSVGFGCKHDQIERPAARESKGDEMRTSRMAISIDGEQLGQRHNRWST
jgi:hypothetical protein